MKKSLLALAVLGAFAGVASAQSSVTLYGILDYGLQRTDPGSGSAKLGLESGIQSGSRWGLRGTEALGNGWSALFTLESGFNGDTGTSAQSSRLFGRQAWAALRNDAAGTFAAGRFATFSSGTGSFDMIGKVDPFGTGFSVIASTFSSLGGLRVDNAVLWQSPDWAGFRLGAGYSFNGNGSEVAGSDNNNRVIFTGANYTYGPLFVALTYDQIKPTDASGLDDEKRLQFGGTYDFKVVKLHAAYAKEDSTASISGLTTAPNVTGADADAWMVGFTVPVGNLSIVGSYSKRDGDALNGTEYDRNVWALGALYSLSRRTNLYFAYADSEAKKDLRYVGYDSSVPTSTSTYDFSVVSVGVRHSF